VNAPPSKSSTIRGLTGAALADGISEVVNPLSSDDTEAAARVLTGVGVGIEPEPGVWRVSGGQFHEPTADLFCGDSAATLRFMTALCALVPGTCRLTAGASLATRPVKPLVEALRQLGVNCSSHGEVAPVTVVGGTLRGGATELPGNVSSQFVSALLLVAPRAEQGMSIRLTSPLESKSYVMMTVECLSRFGIQVSASRDKFDVPRQTYQPTRYVVEGDWSSASYLLALGATCGAMKIGHLNQHSVQGDRALLDYLREMGAEVGVVNGAVRVSQSRLRAIRADLSECIDLLPTMAVLAAVADGVSEFTGIERARIKESDRVAAVMAGLTRMGIATAVQKNRLTVTGGAPRGAVIDSRGDHRIAMAFSVLGAVTGETVIEGAECIAKTFPGFWDILVSVGGRLERDQ